MMHSDVTMVHGRAGGTSLVMAIDPDVAPQVLYWGPDLGELPGELLKNLATAHVEALSGNAPGVPVRVPVIPENRTGWNGRPGLVGHRGAGRAWSPRLTPQDVQLECSEMVVDLDGVATTGPGVWRIRLEDARDGLSVLTEVHLMQEGMVRIRARLLNEASEDYHLEELSVALPLPLEAKEILDFSGRWGRERAPIRVPFELGCRLHEQRRGRTGFDAPMMMFTGEQGFGFRHGQVWGIHSAFSGNLRVWAEKCPDGRQLIGGGELLLPGEMTLATGEAYSTPWVYFCQAEGLDEAADRVHSWLRSRPGHPDTNRPVTLNVWEAVYFDHDLRHLVELAESAAGIGVERFVLDDGWFRGRHDPTAGLGDWYPDEDHWPNGLLPLSSRVHELGMEFGLWFEPEMVNPDSDLARAHPEWVMATSEEWPVEWRHQQVLNLAIPEAYEYVRSRMSELVREYRIDYIKWDHNRDLLEPGNQLAGGRACVHEQTLASYRLMDSLTEDHPGLEIESCSSGGARIDLEMAQHAVRFWPSDCIDPLERQSIMRWTEQLIPLEMLGNHVASPKSRTTGRVSALSFRAGTALWGHFGIEWDVSTATPAERAELSEWISFYKSKRDLLFTGRLVRGDSAEDSLWIQGVIDRDRREALYELTTRHRSAISPRGRFRLPGLDPDTMYRVRPVVVAEPPEGLFAPPWFGQSFEGVVMTGRMLDQFGLHTPKLFTDQVLLFSATAVDGQEEG
ncbi:MAG: alpha-galactosidase [Pauljensenia sp.]